MFSIDNLKFTAVKEFIHQLFEIAQKMGIRMEDLDFKFMNKIREINDGCALMTEDQTDWVKAQKQVLANRISGEGCEANPDWRPGWMQVPPTRLVDGAGSPPADAWTRIASLFEAGAENASDETPEHQNAA